MTMHHSIRLTAYKWTSRARGRSRAIPGHQRFNLDELDPGPGTPVWYHHPKIRLQELISGVISSCYFYHPS